MEDWIKTILQGYGLAGLVIMILGWAVYQMYKNAQKVTKERLADIPVLVKALENNTQATRDNAQAILARNSVTEELTRAIDRQAVAFQLFTQKYEIQIEDLKNKVTEYKMVIDSLAEASRNNTGVLRDIRTHMEGNNHG